MRRLRKRNHKRQAPKGFIPEPGQYLVFAGRGERVQLVIDLCDHQTVCQSCGDGSHLSGFSVLRVAGQVGSSEFAHYFCFSCLLVFLAQYGLVGFSVVAVDVHTYRDFFDSAFEEKECEVLA